MLTLLLGRLIKLIEPILATLCIIQIFDIIIQVFIAFRTDPYNPAIEKE